MGDIADAYEMKVWDQPTREEKIEDIIESCGQKNCRARQAIYQGQGVYRCPCNRKFQL